MRLTASTWMSVRCAVDRSGQPRIECQRLFANDPTSSTKTEQTDIGYRASHRLVCVLYQRHYVIGVGRCHSGSGRRHLATDKSHDTVRQTE